jgi:hypothetical protein
MSTQSSPGLHAPGAADALGMFREMSAAKTATAPAPAEVTAPAEAATTPAEAAAPTDTATAADTAPPTIQALYLAALARRGQKPAPRPAPIASALANIRSSISGGNIK